jgi:AraC-like DNA-binding protein
MGGEGQVELGDQGIYLGPEAGLLIPPGCPHREHTDHAHWDTLWLGFRGNLPDRLGVAAPLVLNTGYALRPWLGEIWLWRQRETGATGPELAALTEFVLRAFVRLARQDGGMTRKPWLATVQDYIDHHLQRDLPVEELAALAGCSVGHFHRTFRQATGETPVQCVTRRRMETALLHLRESGLPIREIAEAVGFRDPLYFSRVFRRHFGQSPSRMRP